MAMSKRAAELATVLSKLEEIDGPQGPRSTSPLGVRRPLGYIAATSKADAKIEKLPRQQSPIPAPSRLPAQKTTPQERRSRACAPVFVM